MKSLAKYIIATVIIASLIGVTTVNTSIVLAQRDMSGMASGQDQSMASGQDQSMASSSQRDMSGMASGQDQSMASGQDQSMASSSQRDMSGMASGQDQSMASAQGQSMASLFPPSFWVSGGFKTIFIFDSLNTDHGWADLCAKKSNNQFTCFGSKNWQTNNNGFATASFFVPAGWYKCFDSMAQSNVDKWWNPGVSKTSAYADHFKTNWHAPPINWSTLPCATSP